MRPAIMAELPYPIGELTLLAMPDTSATYTAKVINQPRPL